MVRPFPTDELVRRAPILSHSSSPTWSSPSYRPVGTLGGEARAFVQPRDREGSVTPHASPSTLQLDRIITVYSCGFNACTQALRLKRLFTKRPKSPKAD